MVQQCSAKYKKKQEKKFINKRVICSQSWKTKMFRRGDLNFRWPFLKPIGCTVTYHLSRFLFARSLSRILSLDSRWDCCMSAYMAPQPIQNSFYKSRVASCCHNFIFFIIYKNLETWYTLSLTWHLLTTGVR